jgi:PhoH-like ATPase
MGNRTTHTHVHAKDKQTMAVTKRKSIARKTRKKALPYHKKQRIPTDLRRLVKKKTEKITYVLDTNVILNAWDALFAFEEHTVCLVSRVWQELDKHKKGRSDEAWNARKAIRIIDSLIAGKSPKELRAGIPLTPPAEIKNGKPHNGKLILDFSRPTLPESSDVDLSLDEPDDQIIMICLALKAQGLRVVLISNDGNCRVKATIAGIEAEEYLNLAAPPLTGEEDTHTGFHFMPHNFWEQQGKDLKPEQLGRGIVRYNLEHPLFKQVHQNEFLVFPDGLKLIVTEKLTTNRLVAETFTNFHSHHVWGIEPRNLEQELALQLLMDDRIPCVSIAGLAGSGKTFLAIGTALHQVFELKKFDRIIITRATIGSDEDIGFLPGDEKEKMGPWMGALYDNLEMLISKDGPSENGKKGQHSSHEAALMQIMSRINIKSLNFMKGRTFNRTLLIVDETQDLTAKKLKMIATRVGPDSKIVFLGNVAQIDDSYLTEHTCGMSILIRTFADSTLVGHITLQRGERSPFATEAEQRL